MGESDAMDKDLSIDDETSDEVAGGLKARREVLASDVVRDEGVDKSRVAEL